MFKPIIAASTALANAVLRLFRVEPKDEATSTYTLDEVAGIVEQSTREGVLTDTTGTLTAAFEFTAKKVADVEVRGARDRTSPWVNPSGDPAGRRRPRLLPLHLHRRRRRADRLPAPQGRHRSQPTGDLHQPRPHQAGTPPGFGPTKRRHRGRPRQNAARRHACREVG